MDTRDGRAPSPKRQRLSNAQAVADTTDSTDERRAMTAAEEPVDQVDLPNAVHAGSVVDGAAQHNDVKQDKGKGRESNPETTLSTEKQEVEVPERPAVDETNGCGKQKSSKKGKLIAVHGNYQDYYRKRRFAQDPYAGDERLALIPKEWMTDKRVLDVGCNAGKVTIEIAQTFGPYRVTGVDIDADLIRKASSQARIAWSQQEPLPHIKGASRKESGSRSRRQLSHSPSPIDAEEFHIPERSHFPLALSRMFGFLPQLPTENLLTQYIRPTEEESTQRSRRRDGKFSRGNVMPKKVALFPNNLRFKKADWVKQEITSDKTGYGCILALSVAKWIHLNGGDEGLIDFFTRVFTTLHPDGRFILEPQPWSSYAKASRMTPELKASYQSLKLRPDEFERILLEEIGFQKVEKLSEQDEGGFKRPLHVYYKAAGSWL